MMHLKIPDFRRTTALCSGIRAGMGCRQMRWRAGVLALAFFAVAALAAGCTARDPMRVKDSGLPGDDVRDTAAAAQPSAPSAAELADDSDLDQIWRTRSAELSSSKDYPIGPGDVLTVSVPQMDELQDRKVRVTPLGTVELPLIGAVRAGGLTEEQLEAELDRKLNDFMYNPQASVYVNEYHNREVAVIGAVNHPGLVLLNSPS